MHKYNVEYTDTFAGEANYSWVKRKTISMPQLTHYGYNGSNYGKVSKVFDRELMRKAKAAMGLTGVRGRVEPFGDGITFYPYKSSTVMFITYEEGESDDT